MRPFLSIVIPAYNEEKRLPAALSIIATFLEKQPYQAEVIVVENGSSDRTFDIGQIYAQHYPNFRVIHSEERGKGLAVRRGMLEAAGQYCFMCDADLSMPIEEVNRFLPPRLDCCDIAIASREAPGAVRYNEPAYRHFVGRGFNTLIRLLALPGLQDTQCGFKCFRGDIVQELFLRQTLTGWSFDVEVLFIARKRGYKILEIPIQWYFNKNSKVRVIQDSIRMGLDLITIRLNSIRGVYDRPAKSRAA
jgi:glycosyltransferase involved in cell wall biosynthesis